MKLWPATLFAAGALVAPPLGAQGGNAGSSSPAFQDVVDVEILNLDVYVTDASGSPVTDLERDDFELLLDGQTVETTNFYAVRDGLRRGGPGSATGRSGSTTPADPVFLVLFVDNLHLGQFTRNRALDELKDFLRQRLRDDDQVMLVSFDGRVRVRQVFTREWKPLDRALGLIAREPSFGQLRESQERQLLTDMMSLSDLHKGLSGTGVSRSRCPSQVGQMATRHAQDVYNQVRVSISGLSQFVTSLASLPGRKALIHLSDGIPYQPGAGVFEFLLQYCTHHGENLSGAGGTVDGDAGADERPLTLGSTNPVADADVFDVRRGALEATRHNTTALFEDLARRSNAHRVTFFTVEAAGARTLSASEAGRSQRRTLSRRADEVRWASLQDSLTTMAEVTGGRAILDTTDLSRGLESIGRDLGTYYSLGYRLPKSEDGRTLDVQVQVKKPGLEVRHRQSLRSESLQEELAGRTQAALMYGVSQNPLAVELETGEIRAMDGLHMVPIWLRIPLSKVTLVPDAGGHRGQLRIFVAGRDRQGRVAQVRATEVPIEVPAGELEAARARVYLYEVKMLMRDGDHKVAVGIHDDLGSVASFVTGDVHVSDR